MELAAIAPMKLLEDWPKLAARPTHMCLAQLALGNSKHLEWMRARAKEGKTVILDNGAYEGQQVSPGELVSLACYLRPRLVVVPDTPNDSRASIEQATHFASEWQPVLQKFCIGRMMIAHCDPGDWQSLERCLLLAKRNYWAVGLSRLTSDFGLGCGNRRDKALFRLWADTTIFDYWKPYIHMFGFGGLEELHGLVKLPHVPTSIDTSAPIWRGLQGYSLTDKWPDYPFELAGNYEWRSACEAIAQQNLEEFDAILSADR